MKMKIAFLAHALQAINASAEPELSGSSLEGLAQIVEDMYIEVTNEKKSL